MKTIPYDQLHTICFDVGGTLMAIQFDVICAELQQRGVTCTTTVLMRAEAASRPLFSAQYHELCRQHPDVRVAELFLRNVFQHLPPGIFADHQHMAAVTHDLVPVFYPAGGQPTLWTYVLPGVREALAQFRVLGLQMLVVSNADGTVEQSLVEKKLRPYFDVVIDSHVVQVEKPDPQIFHIALERAGADPARTVYVGDMYHFDIVGARAAGLHAILLDPYGDWPDVDCERMPDLLTLSARIAQTRTC
jgi:HAD superfamily hydrolase (TIGR01509 family)